MSLGPERKNRLRTFHGSRAWRYVLCGMMLSSAFSLPGCIPRWAKHNPWLRSHVPMMRSIPASATAADVAQYLNSNIAKLHSWRSDDVAINMKGRGLLKLSASLAVESHRNLRLRAQSIAGTEVDMGSNSDQFWFWARRSEPKHVFVASHEQAHLAQIPFEPDWLTEALGVIPIDPASLILEPLDADSRLVRLISQHRSPQGMPVQKEMVVDTLKGVVVEHVLRDLRGQEIAKATLSKHANVAGSGVIMPHRVDLSWPMAGMDLTMTLKNIEINPENMSDRMWQIPEYPDYPRYDLGAQQALGTSYQ